MKNYFVLLFQIKVINYRQTDEVTQWEFQFYHFSTYGNLKTSPKISIYWHDLCYIIHSSASGMVFRDIVKL